MGKRGSTIPKPKRSMNTVRNMTRSDPRLGGATCAAGFAVAVPFIAVASIRVKKVVRTRQVPTLAMLSAVCFLVMMFNVPIPDGTTAHAMGASLVAVLLGGMGYHVSWNAPPGPDRGIDIIAHNDPFSRQNCLRND